MHTSLGETGPPIAASNLLPVAEWVVWHAAQADVSSV
jgi:hypothetical protein